MIEKGLVVVKKFNETFGKEFMINCDLNYNFGIGMKLMFNFPIICFEINLISSLGNLS